MYPALRYFYLFTTVVTGLLVFFPPFDDPAYGTLFDMAGRRYGTPALIGLMLFLVLIVLLIVVAFYEDGIFLLPGAVAALAAMITAMLILKPATDDPPYSATGLIGTIIMGLLTIVASVHTVRRLAADLRT